uniref:Oxysterol-binding protein n=1 Tax=Ciona savignyi TaxID=51511 RepID=H2YL60_CIOSA
DGTLSKYTNVMKGWQNRYFILNPQTGVLEYHVNQSEALATHYKPRGLLPLEGAVVAPSIEDSCTFSVNASNGEVYKLRATNAKERQEWVNRLRSVSEHYTSQIAHDRPPLAACSLTRIELLTPCCHSKSYAVGQPKIVTMPTIETRHLNNSKIKQLQDARESVVSADNYHAGITNMFDGLDELALDRDVLLMKSTSISAIQSLSICYNILHKYNQNLSTLLPQDKRILSFTTSMSHIKCMISWVGSKDAIHSTNNNTDTTVQEPVSTKVSRKVLPRIIPVLADPVLEVEDELADDEEDLGAVDEHKNVIMHLLSQIKLGMDLTTVTLPTFILEKRSLLEMYSDFVGYPQLLLNIPQGNSPVERMHRVLKFFLTSFRCGRKGQHAKKPYNPILGEVFQCSYNVGTSEETQRVQFIAEQVSHHPPISAFHINAPGITVTSSIWTKSKFMNMSVGVVNIGEGVLTLPQYNETYVMTYPSAYARSILTVPWTELGGRCTITCQSSNLTAAIMFHTKTMYGGLPHRVTAEVKDGEGNVTCRVQGQWNVELNFTYYKVAVEEITGDMLVATPKRVQPLHLQCPIESRALWKKVTQSLRDGDIAMATKHKSKIEDDQRKME